MKKILGILCIGVSLGLSAQNWKVLETPTETTARSENSIVAIGSKIYLFGGRGMKPMEVYDTKTNTWETRGALPLEIHHFQAATYNGEIYVAGALSGPFPHEIPIPNIYIYNPDKDEWRKGDEIPRKRGAAGCFVYRDKIYVVNGIQDGHWDGHVSWFDEYDPKTGDWRELPDSPHPRDHINVGMVKSKLVVAAGRRSNFKEDDAFSLVSPYTDIYDFKTNVWTTVIDQDIPTRRAGIGAVTLGNKVYFIGGEGPAQKEAHDQVEAFNVKTMSWEIMPKLNQGRHGIGATKVGKNIYVSSGVSVRGGRPELNSMECLGCK
ncbi:MAG: N-acetylneuraminic acid mutarotase [Algoriphagus sp.]|jgi:N-acetylneuraminic acid mutarotase